jgi:asparagine synthase (glutamine-hydrolysing)
MGAKPMYYTTATSGTFIFASEMKSLLEHPAVQVVPDMMGVDAYLSLGYMPGPNSMFKGVHELKPGHRILWNPGLHVMIEPYWAWESYTAPDPSLKTNEDFQARFNVLFDEAVALRQAGNARMGAFGRSSLESAALLASMSKNISGPVRVYAPENETAAMTDGLPPVSDIAGRLGAQLQLVPTGPLAAEQLPQLVWALDEPVADLGVLTRHLLARTAASGVDGVLSFTGADALFVSYPAQEMILTVTQMQRSRFALLRKIRGIVPVGTLARLLGYSGTIGGRTRQKLYDILDSLRRDPVHRQFTTLFSPFDARDKQHLFKGELEALMETFVDTQVPQQGEQWRTPLRQLLAMQRDHWLPDAVLAPFDKLTGLNGVAGHLPFMDHKLFEFMLGIPDELRQSTGRRKSLLRGYVDQAMPGIVQPLAAKEVRQKQLTRKSELEQMLAVNPLKEMADVCLSESSVRRRELFHWSAVRGILEKAKTGEMIYVRQVFSLLVLELWFRIYIDHERGWIAG